LLAAVEPAAARAPRRLRDTGGDAEEKRPVLAGLDVVDALRSDPEARLRRVFRVGVRYAEAPKKAPERGVVLGHDRPEAIGRVRRGRRRGGTLGGLDGPAVGAEPGGQEGGVGRDVTHLAPCSVDISIYASADHRMKTPKPSPVASATRGTSKSKGAKSGAPTEKRSRKRGNEAPPSISTKYRGDAQRSRRSIAGATQ